MQGKILVGIIAGLAAAVVFISATTGPLATRLILFLVTPLPLFLAGFGWGWITALIAGLAGALAMALLTTPAIGAVFAISPAIPVAVLSYLVTLNRPASGPGPDVDAATGTEWYPVGRIVIWAAAISGLMALLAMLMLGPDLDTLRTAVRSLVSEGLKPQIEAMNGGKALGPDDIDRLSEMGLYVLPAATALSWMLTALFNLWLAGRIALASGKLPRPWPDIAAMRFPRTTPLVLAAATVATLLPGYVALGASAVSGAFYFAYVLMGLAVVHFITRGQPWRGFALWGLYAALLVLSTGVSLAIALLGLADGFVSIRRRTGTPPPASGGGRPPGG
ncbi:MAG: DUF2232 domain-containing protein [Hyphomicrobiaceae bacterium]|nr:DUF2232 domain-containing protein [Hyphomicrobiaceae bacterium]